MGLVYPSPTLRLVCEYVCVCECVCVFVMCNSRRKGDIPNQEVGASV